MKMDIDDLRAIRYVAAEAADGGRASGPAGDSREMDNHGYC